MNIIEATAQPQTTEIVIKGNGGSRMSFENGDVVIDLNGIIATHKDGSVPILYGHDHDDQLGFASTVEVKEDGIYLIGKLTMDTKRCGNIRNSWREGQPWEASLGFIVVEGENVAEGQTVAVNGREEVGPLTIAKAIEIMEVSIVTFGADENTSIVQAQREENDVVSAPAIASVKEINVEATIEESPIVTSCRKGIEMENTTTNNVRVASLACLMQANAVNEKNWNEFELEAAHQLKDLDFRSIVDAACGQNPTYAQRSNVGEWLTAASSYGLNNILQTVSSEMLQQFVAVESEPWRDVFKITSCSDTRPNYRYKIGGQFELKKTEKGKEFDNIVYGDEKATIAADWYARQGAVTAEEIQSGAVIGAIADIAKQASYGATECINKVLWSKFLNPGNSQFDGSAFFASTRNNTYSNKALSYATLAEGIGNFYKTNERGINPSILLVPASLWAEAVTLTKATSFYDGASGANVNPITSAGLKVVAVPHLEYASLGGNYSSSSWYLLANPNAIPAFEATFYNGVTTPRVRRQDINIGYNEIRFDTAICFGVAQMDPAGVVQFTA